MNKELKVSIFANLQGYASKEVGMDEIVRLIKYDTIVKQKTAVSSVGRKPTRTSKSKAWRHAPWQ